MTRFAAGLLLTALCPVAAGAQTNAPRTTAPRTGPPRAFVSVNAAAQTAAADLTDTMVFQANAEAGTIEARYPSAAALLLDGSIGFRFSRRLGIAIGGSQASGSGDADITASVPHPLYDNQDRVVEGSAGDMSRTETAAHLQLFYELPTTNRWRVRLFAGPTYMNVEQELVREVTVDETYPYDTATFRSAVTGRATGSGVGFNAGADVAWMFTRRVGAGLLLRYTRASVDLNAPDARTVSLDGGGLQAGAGLRFLF